MVDGLTLIRNFLENGLLYGNDIANELQSGTLSRDELIQIAAGHLERQRTLRTSEVILGGLESSEFSKFENQQREEAKRLNEMTTEELNSWVKSNIRIKFF